MAPTAPPLPVNDSAVGVRDDQSTAPLAEQDAHRTELAKQEALSIHDRDREPELIRVWLDANLEDLRRSYAAIAEKYREWTQKEHDAFTSKNQMWSYITDKGQNATQSDFGWHNTYERQYKEAKKEASRAKLESEIAAARWQALKKMLESGMEGLLARYMAKGQWAVGVFRSRIGSLRA